jgi:polysaccharide pyruvyl transferase WcaK-like protein
LRAVGLRLPDALLPADLRALGRCDLTCDLQGISFDDDRLLFLPFKVLSIWPSMLLGVPVIKLSQAMGPFRKPLNRFAARWFLSRCRHTYGRGRTTAEFLRELSIPIERWGVAADLAFSFHAGDSLTRENTERVRKIEQNLILAREKGQSIVAVAPSSLILERVRRRGGDYAQSMAEVVSHLVMGGHRVVVLPNATREGVNKPRNNDLYAIDRIAELLQDSLSTQLFDKILWVTYDINMDAIRSLLAQSDALITSRFHAMVVGLSLGVPTLVIGWSHKYREVLADFGCEEYAVDFGDQEAKLLDMVDELVGRRLEIRERITRALPTVCASSAAQFSFLSEIRHREAA